MRESRTEIEERIGIDFLRFVQLVLDLERVAIVNRQQTKIVSKNNV